MSQMPRLLLCALAVGIVAAAALLLVAPAATPTHPIVGIGDDKPDCSRIRGFWRSGSRTCASTCPGTRCLLATSGPR